MIVKAGFGNIKAIAAPAAREELSRQAQDDVRPTRLPLGS
jgi:hypothetical protein